MKGTKRETTEGEKGTGSPKRWDGLPSLKFGCPKASLASETLHGDYVLAR